VNIEQTIHNCKCTDFGQDTMQTGSGHSHIGSKCGPEPYIFRYIRCAYGFLAGKSPYIRSYTVQTYGSGQPYI